jgi:Kef-type K+ transport system membrane component KefB
MIVVALAFIVPILLHRLRMRFVPVVVAEIAVGIVVGKTGFNLIAEDPWLELLSMLGLIYLMFLSGLELNFSMLRSPAKKAGSVKPIPASLVMLAGIFLLSFGLSFLISRIGLIDDPYLMTIIVATISLGVVLPVLKEKRMTETPLGQTILFVTVLSDLATMILLAVYIALSNDNSRQMLYLLLFFAAVLITYAVLRRMSNRKVFDALRRGTVQIGTRFVFALILLFVVLSETLNVETILGAFLAGVIVSLLAPNKELVHQLDSFGYGFLIPIFFVMVGVNLDLRELFADPDSLVLIPLLLGAVIVSKMIPALILKRWYGWKQALGAGFLLSSTLSLVIAASKVAREMGLISASMEGALILVAIISCLAAPILFNWCFPAEEARKSVIAIIGANHITMPVSQDLLREGYTVVLYSAGPASNASKDREDRNGRYPIAEVPDLRPETLERSGMLEADVVVLGTMDDDVNIALARRARDAGIERVILRVEDPERHDRLQQEGEYILLSTLYASRTLLKALIEHPSAVQLITRHDDSVQEVEVNNGSYDRVLLRDLPYLENTLVMRIYRGHAFLIPHGNTEIRRGDRLLVSGDADQIQAMRLELQ